MKSLLSKNPMMALLVVVALAAGTVLLAGYVDGSRQGTQATADCRCIDCRCIDCPKAGSADCCKEDGTCPKAGNCTSACEKSICPEEPASCGCPMKAQASPGADAGCPVMQKTPCGAGGCAK